LHHLVQIVGDGNLVVQEIFQPDEVHPLGHGEQRKQIADFVADAAHEFSTPLTVLRGEIELALRRERLAEDYRIALQVCREETDRLTRLSAHLLQLASADAGQSLLARNEIDLAPLCAEMTGRWQAQADERGLALRCEAPESLCLSADAAALERILHNLSLLFDRNFKTAQDLNRYRKQLAQGQTATA
jgi:signal transduction histidine kinase